MNFQKLCSFSPVPFLTLALSASAIGCGAEDTPPAAEAPVHYEVDETHVAGPFTVEPGEELVMCTYVRGNNETEEDITVFTTEQTPGGHHLIVYTVDHPVDLPPARCAQGGQPGWSQILVTQIEHDQQAFPAGIGFHVAPHQQYVMETHYINLGADPLTVESSFGTTYGEPGSVEQRAATYFFGTMNIDVAPGAAAEESVQCVPPEPMVLHTMFGHEHRWGTGVDVDLVRPGASDLRVYESTDWEDPEIARFDKGISLGESDAIRVSCGWNNLGTEAVRFPHEMCFAIGYYWPAESGVVCVSGGQSQKCECRYQGRTEAGPGGAEVSITVRREDDIVGAGGPLDTGAPVYCALFVKEDWDGFQPKPGANPRYFLDAVDQPMASSESTLRIDFVDVSPGDYKVSCMMDTIGGGWIIGSGDVVALTPADVHVEEGDAVEAEVVLDFAMP